MPLALRVRLNVVCRVWRLQGTLKGVDQAVNLVLDKSHERVFSTDTGVQVEVLGLYIIRGDNMYVKPYID